MVQKVIKTTKAPALALTPTQFSQQHFDLFNQQLRVYFNTIDSFNATLSTTDGGSALSFPHISAYDSSSQYAAGDNIPTKVLWATLVSGSGFTLNPDSTATAEYAGIYKIDYSLQFANTDNAQHNVFVWMTVNGTPVVESSSDFTLLSRKSAGVYSYIVAYSHVTFQINAGDVIALWWATEKAYNTVGPVNGIFMEALPAITVPYIRPSNPSAIGTISFVSRL